MSLDFSQVLIQIIAFLIMLWVLKRFGWKPLLDILNERKKKIQSEFDSIATQKDDIKKLTQEYHDKLNDLEAKSRAKIQEAIMHGQKIALEMQEEAQSNVKAILFKARKDIEKEIGKVKNQLKNEMVNTAITISEKILQQKIDKLEHEKLITEFIEEAELK